MSDLLQPGQIFAGKYRVDRFLARGGFGAVYAARHVDTEAKVALKVIWSHVIESDSQLEQFKLEARIASRVDTEHVARVFDVGRDADTQRPYLVLELLEGRHFEQIVRDRGTIPKAEVALYFRQIGYALDKAHRYVDEAGTLRPIVHRDLKPENLFLTRRENGEPLVKIIDFGLAKVVSVSAAVSTELKGTPLFMAFEQATVAPVTPQTDIWALGLVAFYLLTGRIYWKTANAADSHVARLFTEVLSARLDPASSRARELEARVIPSAAFDEWFSRCVNRDVMKRFDTAGECADALAAALVGPEWEQVPVPTVHEPNVTTLGIPPTDTRPSAPPSAADHTSTLRSLPPRDLEGSTSAGGTSTGPPTVGSVVRVRRSRARLLVVALVGVMVLILVGAALSTGSRSDDATARERPVQAAAAPTEPAQQKPPPVDPGATVRVEPVIAGRREPEKSGAGGAVAPKRVRAAKATPPSSSSEEDDVYGER
jgi:serine/threonine-protein kinase